MSRSMLPGLLIGKGVSGAAYGESAGSPRRVSIFAAQPADLDIDHIRLRVEADLDRLEQHRSRHDPVSVQHEIDQ